MTIYDRLTGKKYDTIKKALEDIAKYFTRIFVVSQDDLGVVVQVTGTYEQREAFEPKFVWEPVIPEGISDPKARVHWSTVIGLRRDHRSKSIKYIL